MAQEKYRATVKTAPKKAAGPGKRPAQAVKKGKILTFHWRGGYLTREILGEMLQIFEEEAAKKEKHAYLSLNWPQAVLQVSFKEQVPQQQVIMEEANEGEMENDATDNSEDLYTDLPQVQ